MTRVRWRSTIAALSLDACAAHPRTPAGAGRVEAEIERRFGTDALAAAARQAGCR